MSTSLNEEKSKKIKGIEKYTGNFAFFFLFLFVFCLNKCIFSKSSLYGTIHNSHQFWGNIKKQQRALKFANSRPSASNYISLFRFTKVCLLPWIWHKKPLQLLCLGVLILEKLVNVIYGWSLRELFFKTRSWELIQEGEGSKRKRVLTMKWSYFWSRKQVFIFLQF